MILHGGDTILFHTQLVLLPESNLGLFVSYNSPSGESGEQAGRDLMLAFMDHYYPLDATIQICPNPSPVLGKT